MSRPVRLAVVGDALLDRDVTGEVDRVCPDAPVPVLAERSTVERPGGAGLAALLAARDGCEVTLVTALGSDEAGARLRGMLAGEVRLHAVPLPGGTPVKTRMRAAGQSLLRIDSGGPGEPGAVPPETLDAIGQADGVLVSDYGRGLAARPELRTALAGLASRLPVVWDPHPRGAAPVPGVRLVTPNLAEAAGFAGCGPDGGGFAAAGHIAARLVERWQAGAVAVTMGRRGALLSYGGEPPLVAPVSTAGGPDSRLDTCGAGDRFAATAAVMLAARKLPSEAVVAAVRAATEFVLAGGVGALRAGGDGAAAPVATRPGVVAGAAPAGRSTAAAATGEGGAGAPQLVAEDVVSRIRATGGTVVATGGCFDLLHAGHIRLLRAARALGDCLVVCLNSDESVRRLKGPGRPVVGQEDRIRVLEALEYVDAAVVFEQDTPEAVLAALRPDIWVKGGDYGGMVLPECEVLARWGGQAVLLPYQDGQSTTRLIENCRSSGRQQQERSGP